MEARASLSLGERFDSSPVRILHEGGDSVTIDRSFEHWRRRVRVAQGLEPADTVIAGGAVLNVFTQRLVPAEVAIVDGVIAGIGPRFDAHERVDHPGSVI